VKLGETEMAMLAGEEGEVRRRAISQQIEVGRFFGADDFVPVAQAHIMADTESLGQAGVAYLEEIAGHPKDQRRVLVPTITDPRGADFKSFERINQDPAFVEMERRADAAFRALGVLMTDTCINYQTVIPPVRGEHLAMGDTGVVIYCNSVFGARTNYEGGPAALAAALTGVTPRYGFHLDRHRRGNVRFEVADRPASWTEWGALGAVIGRAMESYFQVPVIDIAGAVAPTSDELKHFGAALASYGSTALFHMVGVTPEAPDLAAAFDGPPPDPITLSGADLRSFLVEYDAPDDTLDVVVFAAPQLSLFELQALAGLLEGRSVHPQVSLIVATSPENAGAAERLGLAETIEGSGAILLQGVCFYQMHARELGLANGWTRLMTNSAKLVNIIGGYGYQPVLADMGRCVDSAVAGRIVR
jgi:predicted aconitase